MVLGVKPSISLETVLAQTVVVSVPAHIVLVAEDLLARIAEIEEGVWDLVEDELHHHRRGQHAVPQRVELQEVALTETQELVSLVQKGIRDHRIALHHRRQRWLLDGRQGVRVIDTLHITTTPQTHSLGTPTAQEEGRAVHEALVAPHSSPHDDLPTVRTRGTEIHDHETSGILQHRFRVLAQKLGRKLLDVVLENPVAQLRLVLRRGGHRRHVREGLQSHANPTPTLRDVFGLMLSWYISFSRSSHTYGR